MANSPPLKIVFAGTPEFAAHHLRAIIHSDHQVVAVYTQPDRPAGRGKKLQASPVKQLAEQHGLPVQQPQSLKSSEAQRALSAYCADVMIVVAYGLILPTDVLAIPRLGCLNVHASLLPRWRGAAPIQRAIEAGDSQTGITIMQMDEGLDTGDMLLKAACPITAEDNASQLHDRLAALGPGTLLEVLGKLAQQGRIQGELQNPEFATYARKLDKSEALLDWTEAADVLARKVRAFNPFPVAYTILNGERLRIFQATAHHITHKRPPGTLMRSPDTLQVACRENSVLQLELVQMPGKKAMPVAALLNGFNDLFSDGTRLGH